MLALSTLHTLLAQVLVPPALHSAVLVTQSGALVSFATHHPKLKDHVRVIAGLSSEVWQETRDKDHGMVDSEVTLICIYFMLLNQCSIEAWTYPRVACLRDLGQCCAIASPTFDACMSQCHRCCIMGRASNEGTHSFHDAKCWTHVYFKGEELTSHLAQPLAKFRDVLTPSYVPPRTPAPLR